MEIEQWTTSPVPNRGDDLFNAIITSKDGKQLIAQCTTLTFAERIAWLHNHTAKFLLHVTGTGDDSVEHYWPNDCDVCKEICAFLKTPPNNAMQPTAPHAPESSQDSPTDASSNNECTCPCLDCIEGHHCGEQYFDDNENLLGECQYPHIEERSDEDDDEDFREDYEMPSYIDAV